MRFGDGGLIFHDGGANGAVIEMGDQVALLDDGPVFYVENGDIARLRTIDRGGRDGDNRADGAALDWQRASGCHSHLDGMLGIGRTVAAFSAICLDCIRSANAVLLRGLLPADINDACSQ